VLCCITFEVQIHHVTQTWSTPAGSLYAGCSACVPLKIAFLTSSTCLHVVFRPSANSCGGVLPTCLDDLLTCNVMEASWHQLVAALSSKLKVFVMHRTLSRGLVCATSGAPKYSLQLGLQVKQATKSHPEPHQVIRKLQSCDHSTAHRHLDLTTLPLPTSVLRASL